MDLAERLRRLGYTSSAQAPAPPARQGTPVEAVLRGEWRSSSLGRCFVGRTVYPMDHEHGQVRVDGVLSLDRASLSLMGRSAEMAEMDFRKTAFLDTETTGLAGGTGTYVFLVGLGFFEGDSFCVEQYFMPDYGQERAMLSALAERLRGFSALATFNGKSFDLPLLQTRYLLARQRPPVADPLHLDLLFPARRLWRERLGSCCLSALEEGVLGVQRPVDVPSCMIPSIYHEYVREGDAAPLRPVFAHNEQDILSLLALTVRLGRHLAAPTVETRHPVDLYATGRIYEGAEDWERAVLCYEAALAAPLGAGVRERAYCRLGLVYKRLRRADNAVAVWRSLVARPDLQGLLPYVELAKHLEHRERDFTGALRAVEQGLGMLARRYHSPWQPDGDVRAREELERRRARLHVRLAKVRAAGEESPTTRSRGRQSERLAQEENPCG